MAEYFPAYINDESLLFDAGVPSGYSDDQNGWIGVLDIASGAVRHLSRDDQVADVGAVVANGKAVVYVGTPPDLSDWAMWWVPIEGGKPTRMFDLQSRFLSSINNSNVILESGQNSVEYKFGIVVREIIPPN